MFSILPLLLALLSAILVSVASIMMKKSSDQLSILFAIIALSMYGCSFFLILIALRFTNLTAVYAVSSLSYIFVFLLSTKYLGESSTFFKLIGSLIIILGIILVNIG